MAFDFQTLAALAIVAVAAIWLSRRAFGKGRKGGCSDDCGCPGSSLKVKPSKPAKPTKPADPSAPRERSRP